MWNKSVTQKYIAEKLGISKSTVSRAINGNSDINPETKQKILDLMDELDYRPNMMARALQNKKTMTIGIVVPDIQSRFFSTMISGIEDIASEQGYNTVICQTHENYEREVQSIYNLLSYGVDGIAISVSSGTSRYEHFESMMKNNVPSVFVERVWNRWDVTKVIIDDVESSYNATSHLIERGCKRIALLNIPLSLPIGRRRLNGYKNALIDHDQQIDEDLIYTTEVDADSGYKATLEMMSKKKKPDAIILAGERLSIGAVKALKELKVKIPEEVSLIGFAGKWVNELLEPKLTIISQPIMEMGQKAGELLIQQINEGESFEVPEPVVLDTELEVNASTR